MHAGRRSQFNILFFYFAARACARIHFITADDRLLLLFIHFVRVAIKCNVSLHKPRFTFLWWISCFVTLKSSRCILFVRANGRLNDAPTLWRLVCNRKLFVCAHQWLELKRKQHINATNYKFIVSCFFFFFVDCVNVPSCIDSCLCVSFSGAHKAARNKKCNKQFFSLESLLAAANS